MLVAVIVPSAGYEGGKKMSKRKVLIPLDGSEFSRQIVRVVRTFFEPNDVRLVLFRAAFPPSVSTDVSPQDMFAGAMPMSGSYDAYSRALDAEFSEVTKEREGYRLQLQAELHAEAERLQQAGYLVSTEVHFGDPAQRIIDYVNDEGVDLVAMATHGRSGIGRLVLGSVAERVLRGVSVPVLLMRSAQDPEAHAAPGEELSQSLGHGQPLRLVVATDGTTLAQHGLQMGVELARALNTSLKVLAVAGERDSSTQRQQLMEAVHNKVEPVAASTEIVPLVGYADEVILQYLGKNPADLFIMGAFQDRGAGSSTAIGPTAQRLMQHAPTSVWMDKGRRAELRRVLACVAVDDQVVVDVAAQLARAVGAELSILHVVPPSAASYLATLAANDEHADSSLAVTHALSQGTHLSTVLQGWIGQLEREGMGQDALLLERGTPAETILKVAHDGGYDLIVVGSQSGPGKFLGSVANSVVRFAQQSVMVVRTRIV
jgi:nucleotide-binding universal stress UspA family protein